MKAIVLLNSAAGTLAATSGDEGQRSITEGLVAAGITADVRTVPSALLPDAAREAAASAVDIVIVGGGDGTLSTAAGALAGTAMPLGILPLGTLNHFAKDLRIPLDLPGAIRVIATGHIGYIDVGMVNDRVFINNSSLGIYPRTVLEREAHRTRYGLSKWTAMAMAIIKVFRRFPMVDVRLETDGATFLRKTPLVFLGNNRYQVDLLSVGTRVCLDRGELSLCIANAHGRWAMLKLTARALLGRLEQTRDFESFCLSNCRIDSRRASLHVAVDGEVVRLNSPLLYRVRAGALRVCLPESPDSVSHEPTGDVPENDHCPPDSPGSGRKGPLV